MFSVLLFPSDLLDNLPQYLGRDRLRSGLPGIESSEGEGEGRSGIVENDGISMSVNVLSLNNFITGEAEESHFYQN